MDRSDAVQCDFLHCIRGLRREILSPLPIASNVVILCFCRDISNTVCFIFLVQLLWSDRTVVLHAGGALFRYDAIKGSICSAFCTHHRSQPPATCYSTKRLKRVTGGNQTVVVRNSQGVCVCVCVCVKYLLHLASSAV